MTTAWEALPAVAADLRRMGVDWAVVGGLAVCLRADPRPTADIDVALDVDDDGSAHALVEKLLDAGYRLDESIRHGESGRLATVRLIKPMSQDHVRVDLFFASSGIEAEVVGSSEPLEVHPGLVVPVSGIGQLIAVKLCWRQNPKRDRDLRALMARADADDLEDVRAMATLITDRGHNRGRDLAAALDSWVDEP